MKVTIRSFYILLLLWMLWGCGGNAQKQQQQQGQQQGPVPVNLYEVGAKQVTYFDQYPATIVAVNQVDLRSEVNGYITGIFFDEGRVMKKGQLLYEIDKTRYLATYEQAAADVQIAEANMERAQKDADRYKFLLEKEAVAKQRADYAFTDLKNAKQQVSAAKANLVRANTDLRRAMIKAPFDGTIGISQVKIGTLVTAGQTILNTISMDDPIAVDFYINEKEIPQYSKYKSLSTVLQDSIFTISLPDHSIYQYSGQVQFFDRAVNPATGTLRIRLIFANPEHLLRTGMNCNIRVKNTTKDKVIVLPFKSVTEQMGEYFVYVIQKDTARQRKIVMGPQVGTNVIVFDGIKPGEKIVIDGIQKLKEGAAVTTGTPKPQEEKGKKN